MFFDSMQVVLIMQSLGRPRLQLFDDYDNDIDIDDIASCPCSEDDDDIRSLQWLGQSFHGKTMPDYLTL